MKPGVRTLLDDPVSTVNRRSFFKTLGLGAAGVAAWTREASADAAANFIQANVKRASEPSALKITDLRFAVIVSAPMTCPVIRIDTNQGLVGWGEVRDGSSETYALFLKSRILGENPCNVDKVFRKIKQFGGPARQAGGVCGIEMAMMDLAGKAWGVPCWQMLGGKFRDRVRLYADTTERETAKEQGEMLKARMDARHHVPEAGLRHRLDAQRAGDIVDAAGHQHRWWRAGHASVHRHHDHRQGDRLALGLGRTDSRDDRHGDSACLRPLRSHRREQLHQARQGDGEVEPGVDGRHGALGVHRSS